MAQKVLTDFLHVRIFWVSLLGVLQWSTSRVMCDTDRTNVVVQRPYSMTSGKGGKMLSYGGKAT
jgi:hypothetical protein